MSWAFSAVAYHSLSDTFIINYIQAAWWHPSLAWGKQWVVSGSLMLLGCTGSHIDYHSCFFWIGLHHPMANGHFVWSSIIFYLSRRDWLMEGSTSLAWPSPLPSDRWQRWPAACMEPIFDWVTVEIPSGDLALSPSRRDWLMEGSTSLSLPAPSLPLTPPRFFFLEPLILPPCTPRDPETAFTLAD